MSEAAVFWLFANIFFIALSAFYSMMEMAVVSFNKVRLHYYCIKGMKKADRVRYLLKHPSSLFGTTLIGVNVAMFTGSECAREFHEAIGIDPNWTPLSQVFLVVIFGELVPMFAARYYAEHVTLTGISLIWISSKVLSPFIWILSLITESLSKLLGTKGAQKKFFFSEDEIQKALEGSDEGMHFLSGDIQKIDPIAQVAINIFQFEEKFVVDVMIPRKKLSALSWNATGSDAFKLFNKEQIQFLPVYHKDPMHFTALFKPRDLLKLPSNKRLREIAKPPLYTSVNSKLSDVLKQFKKSSQNIAVCLDDRGRSVGVITQEVVLQEVIGAQEFHSQIPSEKKVAREIFLKDKTFSGSIKMRQFNQMLFVKLSDKEEQTLSEFIISALGYCPEKGDKLLIGKFEFTIDETSLLEIRKVKVSSKS